MSSNEGYVFDELTIWSTTLSPIFERVLKDDPVELAFIGDITANSGMSFFYGITVEGKLFDTMIAHYLFNPDGKHSMDYLSELYLNYRPVSIESIIGKGKKQLSMADLEPSKMSSTIILP